MNTVKHMLDADALYWLYVIGWDAMFPIPHQYPSKGFGRDSEFDVKINTMFYG